MIGWIVLSVAAVAFLLNVVAPYLLSKLAIDYFEADAVLRPRAADPDAAAEPLEVRTPDGVRLSAVVWNRGAGGPVTVFCPEAGGVKWSAAYYAAAVLDAGRTVVAFDFRNQGESGETAGYRPSHWLSQFEVEDARAVVAKVRGEAGLSGREVRLFGVSRGACAAAVVAARDPSVRSVVLDGVYPTRSLMLSYLYKWGTLKVPQWVVDYVPDWHLQLTMDFARMSSGRRRGCRYVDAGPAAGRLRGREVLMIAGKRDSYVPTNVTRRFADACGVGEEGLWVVPGARHNEAREAAREEYDRRVAGVLLGDSGGVPAAAAAGGFT